MCNIAGYVGSRQAAPILIEMLRQQEGFDSGHFTGIATIHEGKLHWRKVVGSTKELIEQTDALSLPGTIGIIHGRTPGNVATPEWAHPFINPEGTMALVVNGGSDHFKDRRDMTAEARTLAAKGYDFPSATSTPCNHPTIAPNRYVHASEVFTFLVNENLRKGMSDWEAVTEVYCRCPSETVSLLLHALNPDRITVGRLNYPMNIGYGRGETFLATAALAFPLDRVDQIHSVPVNSAAEIFAGSARFIPFENPPEEVFQAWPWEQIWRVTVDRLKEGPTSFYALAEPSVALYPKGKIRAMGAVYEVLRILRNRGCIEFETQYEQGSGEGLLRPITIVHLIKDPDNAV